jgi:3-dehydroquinate dehydratase type I
MTDMTKRVAVPTTGDTLRKARDQIMALNDKGVANIELHLGAIKELSRTNLGEVVVQNLTSKLMVTNRHREETPSGKERFGFFGFSEPERLFYLKRMVNIADMVDIEMKFYTPIRSTNSRGKEIVSVHLRTMPTRMELLAAYDSATAIKGASFVKICPTGSSWDDALTMLQFTHLVTEANEKPVITPLMKAENSAGRFSEAVRVLNVFYGSAITFAKDGETGSAPGQLTYGDMLRAFERVQEIGVPKIMETDAVQLEEYSKRMFKGILRED